VESVEKYRLVKIPHRLNFLEKSTCLVAFLFVAYTKNAGGIVPNQKAGIIPFSSVSMEVVEFVDEGLRAARIRAFGLS
jgi:hypothetical protein